MSLIVVDASVAASWMLESQATAATDAFFRTLPDHDAIAPAIFPLEVRSLLLRAERRLALARGGAAAALDRLEDLAIDVHPATPVEALDRPLGLAREAGISFYDAIYLELAVQMDAHLATRDGGLVTAGRRLGLKVHDLRPAIGVHED